MVTRLLATLAQWMRRSGELKKHVFSTWPHLKEDISNIMDSKNKRSHAGQVASPRKSHECDCGDVMDEHLPEVLSPDIKELRNAKRPEEQHKSVNKQF